MSFRGVGLTSSRNSVTGRGCRRQSRDRAVIAINTSDASSLLELPVLMAPPRWPDFARHGDRLIISWNDGFTAPFRTETRDACPCAGCNDSAATR